MRQALSKQKATVKTPFEEQLDELIKEYPETTQAPIESDPVKWLEANRYLKDHRYTFHKREFLKAIARDQTPNVYVAKGRQLGLTELAVGLLLHFATLHAGTVSLYLTSNMERAKFFSKYRLKSQTVQTSPQIAELFSDDDLVLSRQLKNGSLLLFRSSQNDFEASRALPIDYMIIDETQDMNMLALPIARESMAVSKYGRLLGIGTGAPEGSSWERTFHTGEEYTYNSKSKEWIPTQGTISNPNTHSYYLPQSTTGLFTQSQINEKISGYLSRTMGLREIEAAWTSGAEKPFSEAVMRSCLIPNIMPAEEGQVLGIDWGGGRSKTCLVLLHESAGVFYIDDAKIVEIKNRDMQAKEAIRYIERTKPMHVVCDIGGGDHQTESLLSAFKHTTKGHLMANLSSTFDHQRQNRLVNLDKTAAVDSLIDLAEQGRLAIPKRFEWMIKHFTSVQSKLATMAGGQAYTRYFVDKQTAHDDACMATVFAMAAYRIRKSGRSRIVGVF